MSVRRGECWCFAFSFFFLASTPVFLGATAEALTDAAVEILPLVPRFFLSSLALVLVLALVVVALALALVLPLALQSLGRSFSSLTITTTSFRPLLSRNHDSSQASSSLSSSSSYYS
jgi:Na+-driven multidrug efflux pump